MDKGSSRAVVLTPGLFDRCRGSCVRVLSTHRLLVATAIGVGVGILLGVILRQLHLSQDAKLWLHIWGELFLRMLKLIVLPLVVSCLVTGISSLQGQAGGRAGLLTLLYVFGTQLISSVMALLFSLAIKPGREWHTQQQASTNFSHTTDNKTRQTFLQKTHSSDILTDFLRNLFPDNIIRTCIQYSETDRQYVVNAEGGQNSTTVVSQLLYKDGTNMLGVIVFSVAVGFAISAAGKEGQELLKVFKSLSRVMVVIINVVIWYSPFAIVSLVASAIVGIQNLSIALTSVTLYVTTFLICSVLHEFVLLPLIYFLVVRKNPFLYYLEILHGILAATGSASGIVALPIFMNDCKNKLKLDNGIVDFVLPLQISINRNGSAMFVIVSLCFIANINGLTLGATNMMAMCLLTCLMASTVPGIPSGSIIFLMIMASLVKLPIDNQVALILALEWILDRVRTTNNMAGAVYGCAVVEKLCVTRHTITSRNFITDQNAIESSSHASGQGVTDTLV